MNRARFDRHRHCGRGCWSSSRSRRHCCSCGGRCSWSRSWRWSRTRIEDITLRDVDEIEIYAAESKDRVARCAVRLLLQCHRAGRDFMETIVDRVAFIDRRKRNVNRDVAVRPERRLAIGFRQLRVAGISQHTAAAERLHCVLADKTLKRGAVVRLGIDMKVFSARAIGR